VEPNVPFADKEIFFGSIMEYTDERVSLIPDFISNCGMARVLPILWKVGWLWMTNLFLMIPRIPLEAQF